MRGWHLKQLQPEGWLCPVCLPTHSDAPCCSRRHMYALALSLLTCPLGLQWPVPTTWAWALFPRLCFGHLPLKACHISFHSFSHLTSTLTWAADQAVAPFPVCPGAQGRSQLQTANHCQEQQENHLPSGDNYAMCQAGAECSAHSPSVTLTNDTAGQAL